MTKVFFTNKEKQLFYRIFSYHYSSKNGTLVISFPFLNHGDFKKYLSQEDHHYTWSLKARNCHITRVFADGTKIKVYSFGIKLEALDFKLGKSLEILNQMKNLIEHEQSMIRNFKEETDYPQQLFYFSIPVPRDKELSKINVGDDHLINKKEIHLNVIYASEESKLKYFVDKFPSDLILLDTFKYANEGGEDIFLGIAI